MTINLKHLILPAHKASFVFSFDKLWACLLVNPRYYCYRFSLINIIFLVTVMPEHSTAQHRPLVLSFTPQLTTSSIAYVCITFYERFFGRMAVTVAVFVHHVYRLQVCGFSHCGGFGRVRDLSRKMWIIMKAHDEIFPQYLSLSPSLALFVCVSINQWTRVEVPYLRNEDLQTKL